ncbi:lariat debranching enzyme, C-terminal domain-containing protein [Chytriomyces sp. MP71]|nr:lariat debranching enzyme, C-terminal domain-containing protein [Chytriomyces sp. MP71]
MRVAIEGCCHGELDKIYASIKHIESKENLKVDLLIICGDFQSLRNLGDLDQMAVPEKHKKLGNFYEYYSGKKTAPLLTVFIGGNHEGSNYLWELFHGGWVCPNIYFLGFSNVINVGGLRIGGMTGIFDPKHYSLGYHEVIPLNREHCRSIYHVRRYNEYRMSQVTRPIDIFVSHDWPRGIYNYGDKRRLLAAKSFFEQEVNTNTLGSQVNERLLHLLKPRYWFSAHLHVKFAAVVTHNQKDKEKPRGPAAPVAIVNPDAIDIGDSDDEGKTAVSETKEVQTEVPIDAKVDEESVVPQEPRVTKFLALDKCLPRRDFLQILEIEPENKQEGHPVSEDGTLLMEYDEEWIAIVRATYEYLSLERNQADLPPLETIKELIARELEWVKENLSSKEGALVIPRNFVMSAPPHLPAHRTPAHLGNPVQNPQTVAFCETIGLQNKINASYEIATYVPPPALPAPSAPSSNASSTNGGGARGLSSLPPRPGMNLPAPKHDGEDVAAGEPAETAVGESEFTAEGQELAAQGGENWEAIHGVETELEHVHSSDEAMGKSDLGVEAETGADGGGDDGEDSDEPASKKRRE